ncbi:unnamed protein product [Citrullus colocynthis]|uniref:Uncharacterized protein n=1 Tax=Citrullus colocynthis TaxID=252529 RepID=A0ABP0YKD5_9ROSI
MIFLDRSGNSQSMEFHRRSLCKIKLGQEEDDQNHRIKFMNDSTTHYSLVEAVDLAQTSRYNPSPPLAALRRPAAAAALVPRNPPPKDPADYTTAIAPTTL